MATHRGFRSQASEQRRFAKQVIQTSARLDKHQAEQICILTKDQVLDAVQQKYEDLAVVAVDCEKGEVIIDSRGTGSFQQLPRNFRDWALVDRLIEPSSTRFFIMPSSC